MKEVLLVADLLLKLMDLILDLVPVGVQSTLDRARILRVLSQGQKGLNVSHVSRLERSIRSLFLALRCEKVKNLSEG